MMRQQPQWSINIDRFYTDNDECVWNGYREDDIDKLNAHIPASGECSITHHPALEEFRRIQNIYYDIYNNGGCNCIDLNDDESSDRKHWGFASATMASWRRDPARLELKLHEAINAALDELAANESRGKCLRCGTDLTPDVCGDEYLVTGICTDCWTPADDDDDDAQQAAPEGRDSILSGMPMAELLDALTQDTALLVKRGAKGWGEQSFRSLHAVATEIAARLA